MKKFFKASLIAVALMVFFPLNILAQNNNQELLMNELRALIRSIEGQRSTYDQMSKRFDDLMLYDMLGDIAYLDRLRLTGPPRSLTPNPENRFSGNPLTFVAYLYIPKSVVQNKKYPLIVLPVSGVYADHYTHYAHIIRELVAQEYIVVSPEYRGNGGYGRGAYDNLDFNGLEHEDILACRNHMVDYFSIVDPNRVGVIGWNRGGMMSIIQILKHSDKYNCAFAALPLGDLENRLAPSEPRSSSPAPSGAQSGGAGQNTPVQRVSPVAFAKDLRKPLLVHSNNVSGDKVYAEEVLSVIESLKSNQRNFEHKVFEALPGEQSADRIDTESSSEARYAVHKFLERYLNPPKPFRSYEDMRRAAYTH